MIGIRTFVFSVCAVVTTVAFAEPSDLDAKCHKIYQKYASKQGPKAFATSPNGYCGWASRNKSSDAELEIAKTKALGFCMSSAGMECQIVETAR